jgi:hypothetical protein
MVMKALEKVNERLVPLRIIEEDHDTEEEERPAHMNQLMMVSTACISFDHLIHFFRHSTHLQSNL